MNSSVNPEQGCGCGPAACSPASIGRRNFIKASGLTTAMLMAGRGRVMAGPFSPDAFEHVIPSDKKLSKEWVASLYARGEALSATADDLKYIGMPIGGICTGQVYLGGDGRLWYWNLDGKRDAKHAVKGPRFTDPDTIHSPMDQGFALEVESGNDKRTFTLDSKGFAEVVFTNQYPMARVTYADAACPVQVELEAYTPYIPLNRDDSSYPVIVMRYTIKNTSDNVQAAAIAGWVENFSNYRSGKGARGERLSRYRELEGLSVVECWAEPAAEESRAGRPRTRLELATDFGSIALGLLGEERPDIVDIRRSQPGASDLFAPSQPGVEKDEAFAMPLRERGFASVGRTLSLEPGEEKTISFALAWRFPNANYVTAFGNKPGAHDINFYSILWPTASDAAGAVAAREQQLYGTTRTWVDTWYDSTLPYWLLERTFVTLDCMQTQVAERLALQGGLYNLDEGVNCCPGNCTHVWQYAQGLARIFPVIERECRDKIEYGKGFRPEDGAINFRYSIAKFEEAVDGQCGTILRVLRESQMTPDYRFLESIWDRTRLSMDRVIQKWDPDEDGLLAGAQHNTLDEPWYGQVHWLINLYHAALKASATMARQMKQPAVAERYEKIVARGAPKMVDMLWNEQYGHFIHKPGPGADEKHGSTNGCHIDQVLGEFWLHNVSLDRVLPEDKVRRTLESLWTFNFSPNVGDFRSVMTEGRWYAVEGNAGLVMCSFPHGRDEAKSGKKNYAGYLNECMTGFEWQAAAHMIWEGLVEKGLAIGKAIYDRYQPKDRNPYNEVECSDHYARAMASYSVFMAVCGYRYDGPEGKLAFGPRMQQDNFRAAFTTAEGWGSFSQMVNDRRQENAIELRNGKLSLRQLALDIAPGSDLGNGSVTLDGRPVDARLEKSGLRHIVHFPQRLSIAAGQTLRVQHA
ncbi:hypothetical protein Pla175_22370 [Pirellulimonas nuda]|uniref:Uncharacterized protein n=1 Tax=Pirellulimonas nuda TaxID=2528009 RepID=A0A518DBL8_9BACT|nr:GH116 family glycosyl-hydrolase [Pirellulimonas nuda]QDU88853.1 hypothetical protein Pla175_22370 [Pirellulimonas nuda]